MGEQNNKLGDMPAEEFRQYGHQIVDWIADYFGKIEEFPVLSQNRPGDLKQALPASPNEEGEDFAAIFEDLEKLIVPAVSHWNHPHFHGLFSTSTSGPGIFGEMLSAAFDMKAMLWRTSPASTELEEVVLDWLRQMLRLPAVFQGLIYDTASVSTLHAIAMAREGLGLLIREDGMSGRSSLPLLRVYCSGQAHNSIDKAVLLLGLGQRSIVKIECDDKFSMIPEKLNEAIEQDLAKGYLPFCVVATVGTTSTSSIDPIPEIAGICEARKLFLHIDAAYAGPAMIVPELRHFFIGAERADSIVLNPHKWMFTPFDLSVLFVKDLELLKKTFSLVPEYLKVADEVKNQMDYGIQLGRRFRSLKLWFVLRYFGSDGLIARIREHCRLAKMLAAKIDESDGWEMMADVPFALICFRAKPNDGSDIDRFNEQLMERINNSGRAYLSHTKLKGSFSLRLSIGSIRVEETHIEKIWGILNEEKAKMELRQGQEG